VPSSYLSKCGEIVEKHLPNTAKVICYIGFSLYMCLDKTDLEGLENLENSACAFNTFVVYKLLFDTLKQICSCDYDNGD